jgi:hypothetical protein
MNGKIDTLGTVWMALGAFQIVVALMVGLVLVSAGGIAALAGMESDPTGALVAGGVMVGMAVFTFGIILLTAVPGIIAGRALKQRKSWARVLLMILGGMSVLSFPIGTMVGVWTLVVLLDPLVSAEF